MSARYGITRPEWRVIARIPQVQQVNRELLAVLDTAGVAQLDAMG